MTVLVSDALEYLTPKDGNLVTQDGAVFDAVAYSRFKYGYTPVGRDYGHRLARLIIDQHPTIAHSERRVLVASAPYKYLPTASQVIATAFQQALSIYRVRRGLEPAMNLHAIKFVVGSDSYAQADPEERKLTVSQMPVHVDKDLVHDAVVIAVDDVRISGTAEDLMKELLLPCDPHCLCLLPAVVMDPQYALENARIEDTMNKTFQTTFDSVTHDIQAGEFQLNTRVFRTLVEIGNANPEAFYEFLMGRSDALLEQMYIGLVSGTVEMYGRYPRGKATLERAVYDRKLPVMEFITETIN